MRRLDIINAIEPLVMISGTFLTYAVVGAEISHDFQQRQAERKLITCLDHLKTIAK